MDVGDIDLDPSMISNVKNGFIICSILNLHPDFKYLGMPQQLLSFPKTLRAKFIL